MGGRLVGLSLTLTSRSASALNLEGHGGNKPRLFFFFLFGWKLILYAYGLLSKISYKSLFLSF